MNLITDAGKVWHRLWSVRFALISAFFAALEIGLPFCIDAADPNKLLVIAAALAAAGSALSRVFVQPAVHG